MDWDQSRMSIAQGQNIYPKTPPFSIEKPIKTTCRRLLTYVPIKLHKNTVLKRVKQEVCCLHIAQLRKKCDSIFLRVFLPKTSDWEIGLIMNPTNTTLIIIQKRNK